MDDGEIEIDGDPLGGVPVPGRVGLEMETGSVCGTSVVVVADSWRKILTMLYDVSLCRSHDADHMAWHDMR